MSLLTYAEQIPAITSLPIGNVVIAAAPALVKAPCVRSLGPAALVDQANIAFSRCVSPIGTNSQVSFSRSANVGHHIYAFSPAKSFNLKLYSSEP
jgi:hypothetical protein